MAIIITIYDCPYRPIILDEYFKGVSVISSPVVPKFQNGPIDPPSPIKNTENNTLLRYSQTTQINGINSIDLSSVDILSFLIVNATRIVPTENTLIISANVNTKNIVDKYPSLISSVALMLYTHESTIVKYIHPNNDHTP